MSRTYVPSCAPAGMSGHLSDAVLLIAARRSDQISAELAVHDYDTNIETSDIQEQISDANPTK